VTTQPYRLIRKTQLLILNVLFFSGISYADTIGDIVESIGIGSILRNNQALGHSVGTDIVLYDEAVTAKGRMLIEFLDNEELSLTENSKVYIDEVYYDPNPSLSKMSLRMAQGTARFASGAGTKIKKRNISVQTPTAQISINGTDFTTTVDELGRSLIVLLPDEDGISSGEIVVTNQGGSVTINQAYEATMVSSISTAPSPSIIIQNITPAIIDNMFIVSPPKEVQDQINQQVEDDLDKDKGALDQDFLAFDELEQDALENTLADLDYNALDIDFLDVDFLVDLLDVVEELVRTTAKLADAQKPTGVAKGEFTLDGGVFGKNPDSQYNIFLEDGGIVFYRDVDGVISLRFAGGSSVTVETFVDGYEGIITTNGGDDSVVVIKQTN